MASINGRPISVDAVAGLSDEAIRNAIQNGSLSISPDERNQIVEIRHQQGRSTGFNIANAIGQDIGLVGETGVGAAERGGRLALFAASIASGGKTGLAARLLRSVPGGAGILSQARNINSLRSALGAGRSALTTRNVAIAGAGLAGAGAISAGLRPGDTTPITPADLDPETTLDAQNTIVPIEGAEDLFQILDPEGRPLQIVSVAELRSISSDPTQTSSFLSQWGLAELPALPEPIDTPTGAATGNNIVPVLIDGQPSGAYKIVDDAGNFLDLLTPDEVALIDKDTKARKKFIEDFNIEGERLNRALSISQEMRAQTTLGLEQARAQAELAQQLANPRTAAVLRAGIANLPQGTNLSPLLSAFTSTRPGDLSLPGITFSENLATIFGQRPGQTVPVPGASRTETVSTVGQGEDPGTAPATRRVTTEGQTLGISRVPLANVVNSFSADERGLFDALLEIGGISPEDVARQQAQLAPPGSGRGVTATIRR